MAYPTGPRTHPPPRHLARSGTMNNKGWDIVGILGGSMRAQTRSLMGEESPSMGPGEERETPPPSPVKRHPMSACWGSLLPGLPLVARHLQCSSFHGDDPLRGSGRTMDWVGAHMALRSGQSSRPGGCNVCRVVVSARKWQAPACSSWESLEDIVKSRKREFWIRLGGGRPTPWPWVGSSSRKRQH